jgi:biopolymer transport protein ExbD
MAFGTQDDTDDVMNEINMTPMVDIMLVLLIIFIVTVPVMKHAIKIDLPRASNTRMQARPPAVRLDVDAGGNYFWQNQPLDDAQLALRLAAAATLEPQPALQIRADRNVRYERVAIAMAAAQRSGLRKIGFITEPQTN